MALAEALRHEGRLVIGKVHLQLRWQTGYTPSRVAGVQKRSGDGRQNTGRRSTWGLRRQASTFRLVTAAGGNLSDGSSLLAIDVR